MKKIFLRLILLSLSVQPVIAQPTQAEMDKIMKQAQEMMKKYGGDSTANKILNDLSNQQKQVNSAIKNVPKGKTAIDEVEKKDTIGSSIPSRNNRLLNSLPIRTFTRDELVSYLHNLNIKINAYLHSVNGTDINNIPVEAVKQSGTAIGLWMKAMVNESVLVSLKGAELMPDNNVLLNNTGGILTSSGLAVYAIPVLEYVLERQPGNNMILNNLGQAYLDLGDDKKAEQCFLKCVSSYKYYPDANLALAYIYNSRGNRSAAINYVENSLRGAWSSKADNLLTILKRGANMMDYVRHRYKQPEFFNFDKYPMLPQCKRVDDIAGLESQYAAFYEMISS
ncbi:MAG TPA: tetratricopeptide repeat protein, partial [Chitinophagaceae bacterium]|nr:tetratricopeptide repeat protein [Chitinophagaceae bacterium]